MAPRKLERRMNGGSKPVSVKYNILGSFLKRGDSSMPDYLQNENDTKLV